MHINDLTADKFKVNAEFTSRDLTIDGSEIISGGLTINGSGRDEGALVVNNGSSIFNNGVKVYSRDGVITQTLLVVGTSDTTGTDDAEADAGKSAFITSLGVRSLFMGDVTVQDSTVMLDNSPMIAEKIILTKIAGATENTSEMQLLKSGDGWDRFLEGQITYESANASDEVSGASVVKASDIEARGAKKYDPNEIIVKTKKSKKAVKAVDALAKSRSAYKEAMTRAFAINPGKATYRIDGDGNILAKNIVTEKFKASSIVAHDIAVDSFETNQLIVENMAVPGVISAEQGASISGSTQISGNVYNYATTNLKNVATVNFNDKSQENFNEGTRLNIRPGASLVTSDGSDVSLHGLVEIDMANLILFDSRTGKRYSFVLRDANAEEADEENDLVIEFGETGLPDTPASTTANVRKLNDDLTEFAARLKRI